MRIFMVMASLLLVGCSSVSGTTTTVHTQTSNAAGTQVAGVEVVFSEDEIRIIRAYYETHSHSHGKAKHGHKRLPPGIAKKLARGKPLPPGIAKRALPEALVVELPPAPRGYDRIVVAGKILLIEVATQVVHDVLTDAMFG